MELCVTKREHLALKLLKHLRCSTSYFDKKFNYMLYWVCIKILKVNLLDIWEHAWLYKKNPEIKIVLKGA